MSIIKENKKNYLIFLLISVASFLVVYNFASLYQEIVVVSARNEITDFLMEVKVEELDEYLRENGDVVIYVSSFTNEEMLEYEGELENIIREYDLVNNFVFLDTDYIENENFYTNFLNENGGVNVELLTPNIIVFENHEIRDVMFYSSGELDYENTKAFLISNEVIIEND